MDDEDDWLAPGELTDGERLAARIGIAVLAASLPFYVGYLYRLVPGWWPLAATGAAFLLLIRPALVRLQADPPPTRLILAIFALGIFPDVLLLIRVYIG